MLIEKGRIKIISTTNEDSALSAILRNEDDLSNLTEVRSYPVSMPLEFVFRVETGDVTVGEVRIKNIRWFNRKGELSIFLNNEYRNKGYGKEILKEILRFVFEKMNLHRIEAEVNQSNSAGSRLVEGLGFKREGILREAKYTRGAYEDIIRYGLLKKEYQTTTKENINLKEI